MIDLILFEGFTSCEEGRKQSSRIPYFNHYNTKEVGNSNVNTKEVCASNVYTNNVGYSNVY